MGAPIGNQNARKTRLFEDAFIREIKQRDLVSGDGETLRKIAAKMLDKILNDIDVQVFTATRDTVDGKPAQALEHSGPDGEPLPNVINVKLTRTDGGA